MQDTQHFVGAGSCRQQFNGAGCNASDKLPPRRGSNPPYEKTLQSATPSVIPREGWNPIVGAGLKPAPTARRMLLIRLRFNLPQFLLMARHNTYSISNRHSCDCPGTFVKSARSSGLPLPSAPTKNIAIRRTKKGDRLCKQPAPFLSHMQT